MQIDLMQLEFIDIKLRTLGCRLEKQTGMEFIITSLYRLGDPGVHGQIPVRGVDLRSRSSEVGAAVVALVNRGWQYDAHRPALSCAILHGEGANEHIHLQVCNNTVRIE